MPIEKALRILDIARCDICGYARNLSYTPSKAEIDEAFKIIGNFVSNIIYAE